MPRTTTIGAAQLGPIARSESRGQVVKRLLELMGEAHGFGCDLVVFPELALTTFFPRWALRTRPRSIPSTRREMPGPATRPLFEEAARSSGSASHLGYAELVVEGGRKRRFNTSILVDKTGRIIGKYRKIHLPGHADVLERPGQHLEKRYLRGRAISAFRSGAPSAASWACASATTGAGPRPIASWGCRAWR